MTREAVYREALLEALGELRTVHEDSDVLMRKWRQQQNRISTVSEALQNYCHGELVDGDWATNVVHFLQQPRIR